ncbi:hypothetical protein ACJZ2D_014453 [Fusarium nematophilum]
MPGAPTSRKRRFPYTAVACEKCQRRKLKCSGEQPCGRCRDSDSPCLYPRKTRFRAVRRESVPEPRPTCTNRPEDEPISPPSRRVSRFGRPHIQQVISHRTNRADGSALNVFDMDSWSEILRTYEDEVGLQYPFLEIDELERSIKVVKEQTPAGYLQLSTSERRHQEQVEDIALLVLAVISSFGDATAAEIANPLVEELFRTVIVRVHLNDVDKYDLTMLIFTSIFFFLDDREIQAWRGIGTVLRLLLEPTSESQDSRGISDKFFWTVYTLDRRWSFGIGLPFAASDADITRQPLSTDTDLSSAYLKEMVSYCTIASEVQRSILNATPSSPPSARDFSLFRVQQWQTNLPTRLQFRGPSDKFDPAAEKRGDYKLRLMLYLRANQMRTIILRKSSTRLGPDQFDPSNVVSMGDVAQDTIRVLVGLARETDFYHAQHKTFNHFLETALSTLLLVLCWAEPERTARCLGDAVAAMELVRQLSRQSPITRRLEDKLQGIWAVIEGLRPKVDAEARSGEVPAAENSRPQREVTRRPSNPAEPEPQDLPYAAPALSNSLDASVETDRIPQTWAPGPTTGEQPTQLEPLNLTTTAYPDLGSLSTDPSEFSQETEGFISPETTSAPNPSSHLSGPQLPAELFIPWITQATSVDSGLFRTGEAWDILMDYENFSF